MKVQCPSVEIPEVGFVHEPCTMRQCVWWEDRCTAADTIPVGNLTRRKRCALAKSCRWMQQATDGLCPPMKLGEVCEHQGGTYNTFHYEWASIYG